MGFFSKLFGGGDDASRIEELAEEVERYGDRFENSDDQQNAALARDYAVRIRKSASLKQAQLLHAEFLAIIGKDDDAADRENYNDLDTNSDDLSDDS